MSKNTQIGLDKDKSKQLAEGLNRLLANYQLFYINVRGFHWNIKGQNFFALHEKFEEIYTDTVDKLDEIAERILTLGSTPLHAYSAYLQFSNIKEHTNVSDSNQTVSLLVKDYSVLLEVEREILGLAERSGDEGTTDMMGQYIREQEKNIWMLNAFLG